MTSIELLVGGNFLNLIKAELFLYTSYSVNKFGGDFYVIVTVDLYAINNVRTWDVNNSFQTKENVTTNVSLKREEWMLPLP